MLFNNQSIHCPSHLGLAQLLLLAFHVETGLRPAQMETVTQWLISREIGSRSMLQVTFPLNFRHLPKIKQLPSGRGSWTHVVAWPPLQVGHRHIWKLTCYSLYFMMGGRHGRSYFKLSFSSYIYWICFDFGFPKIYFQHQYINSNGYQVNMLHQINSSFVHHSGTKVWLQ